MGLNLRTREKKPSIMLRLILVSFFFISLMKFYIFKNQKPVQSKGLSSWLHFNLACRILPIPILLIVTLLLLSYKYELNIKGVFIPSVKIGINNSSFDTWIKSSDGKLLPEHFSFINSSDASIEKAYTAKHEKCSVLFKQASDNGSFLRYQVSDFDKYKGEKIKLSAWIKSEHKTSDAITIDIQDGINAVNAKTYSNNGTWEQIELIGDIDKNAKHLLLTFKPLDNKNPIYINEISLDTIRRELVRFNYTFITIIIVLLIIIFYSIRVSKRNDSEEDTRNINPHKMQHNSRKFLNGVKEIPVIAFFIYFFYLCVLIHNLAPGSSDVVGVYDDMWSFYHRLKDGVFPQWNPYSLLGRMALSWNQLPVSLFSPFLLFSDFSLEKYRIINIFGTFLSYASIYFFLRMLKYGRYISLLPIIFFVSCPRYLGMSCFVNNTNFYFFLPIALAILVQNICTRQSISVAQWLIFSITLSLSLLGGKFETFFYVCALLMLTFLILATCNATRIRQSIVLMIAGVGSIAVIVLTNAWQLSFLINAVFDNPRLSLSINFLSIINPIFLKLLCQSIMYQAPLLCSASIAVFLLIGKKVQTKILTDKIRPPAVAIIVFGYVIFIAIMYYIGQEALVNPLLPDWLREIGWPRILKVQIILLFIVSIYCIRSNYKSYDDFLCIFSALCLGSYIANHATTMIWGLVYIPLIILGTYRVIATKKQYRFIVFSTAVFMFAGESGVFFFNEIIGIPWIEVRADLVLIPFLAIILVEGVLELPFLLNFSYLLAKLPGRTEYKYSIYSWIIRCAIILIMFALIQSELIPSSGDSYSGCGTYNTTSKKIVMQNICDPHAYRNSILEIAVLNTEKFKNIYPVRDPMKRIFIGAAFSNWFDIETVQYTFLPSYSERLNTFCLYNSDIPKDLANIFKSCFNANLAVHPEMISQAHYYLYKLYMASLKKNGINLEYPTTLTIKPSLYILFYQNSGNDAAFYREILAIGNQRIFTSDYPFSKQDSVTPRVFITANVIKFSNQSEEYDFLVNRANQGKGLTNEITTSDNHFECTDTPKNNLSYTLKFMRDDPEDIELAATLSCNGYLALLDLYNKGWKAFVDGKETQIYKAYIGTRFIRIPQGNHKIEFKYAVPGFYVASIISIISWAVLLIIAFILSVKKSDKGHVSSAQKPMNELIMHGPSQSGLKRPCF